MSRSSPDSDRKFDGKIGIWTFFEIKEAKRSSMNHKKSESVEVDVTADRQCSRKWY